MTHVLPPSSGFWNWFFKKSPEEQAAFAEAHDLDFKPRQLPVDPSNLVPPESELDPEYCDAMKRRAPVDITVALNITDAAVDGFYATRTPHYRGREWFPPEVDLSPYTCPEVRAAS